MNPFHLVVIDTRGIQQYIFGSNRLRENVGASHLVYLATEGWLFEEPDDFLPSGKHNIVEQKRLDDRPVAPDSSWTAELLYSGGGNAVLLFRNEKDAKHFVRNYSQRLLEKAPGLDAVIVRHEFLWSETLLATAVEDALAALDQKKSSSAGWEPLLGLGITAACQSTGLPAHFVRRRPPEINGPFVSVSAEVTSKWDTVNDAKERLNHLYSLSEGLRYPDDFDDLGREKGRSSYIGVVHADGNSLGQVLAKINQRHQNPDMPHTEANQSYLGDMRSFSDAVKTAGNNALCSVLAAVERWNLNGLRTLPERGEVDDQGISLPPYEKEKDGSYYLSIRPIVYGGDDVTFVCEGRIALQAAQIFLTEFSKQQIPGVDRPIAAAGVSIVKAHYPFVRAYQLAEDLAKNAKIDSGRDYPALDWHLAQSGIFESLKSLREREYGTRHNGTLLMRPLAISDGENWRTWENFAHMVSAFQNDEQLPRTQVMDLRRALRESSPNDTGNVRKVTEVWEGRKIFLPSLQGLSESYSQNGWVGKQCVYYDAIEMKDQLLEMITELDEEKT